MSDDLTDADLDPVSDDELRALVSAHAPYPGVTRGWPLLIARALNELAALRARRAQDTPSDPAAADWWGVEYADGALSFEAWADREDADQHRRSDDDRVVPLYRDRAPGAVAAAPTEDESAGPARIVGALARAEALAAGDCDWMNVTRCPRTAPAPSAGEDEAAVERAAEFIAGTVAWQFGSDNDRAEWRDEARGVLAAARGPRTQDDT